MKFILLLILVSLGECSENNTIYMRSSTASTIAELNCAKTCSSINECNPVPTLILLECVDHLLSKSIEIYERSIIKFKGTLLGTRILRAPDTGLLFSDGAYLSISNLIIQICVIEHSSTRHPLVSSNMV